MDVFAIQMEGDVVIESENRQRAFGLWFQIKLDSARIARGAALFQALPELS